MHEKLWETLAVRKPVSWQAVLENFFLPSSSLKKSKSLHLMAQMDPQNPAEMIVVGNLAGF